jgi:cellulose synthase/poly-beta-1,6-N-acetylglucosamine synthase-like glycosyltransferase
MSAFSWLAAAYAFFSCVAWLAAFGAIVWLSRSLPILEDLQCPAPALWPSLSVIIPARNEATTLEPALRSLLEQDYPGLEIVLINDRSTDDTPEIIDRLSARDQRIKTIHLRELPPGWIGKTHALHCGSQQATGEWILFADADVHFAKNALATAMSLVLTTGGDHLVLAPRFMNHSFFQEVVIQAFGILFLLFTRAPRVNSDNSQAFVGSGAFNLVRRAALERTPGFEWLRMEVIDDVGLGLMLKQSGAKSRFAVSREKVSIAWYPTLGVMITGLEKNLFGALASYRVAKMVLIALTLLACAFGPTVALFFMEFPLVFFSGVVAYLSLVAGGAIGKLRFTQRLIPSLFFQIGLLLLTFMLLRSGFYAWLRGGVTWRGTWYSLEELRAGQRLKL